LTGLQEKLAFEAIAMTRLHIRIIPDPVLRQKAVPVKAVDARIVKLMEDMLETMYVGNGIGLAANQVGVAERVITIDISEERNGTKALLMANPEIVWKSEEPFVYREGCLSVPEQYAEVTRPRRIRLTYLDKNNKPQELEAEDLLSVCVQHEIDHINGVLFIDYLSPLKRRILTRKVEKAQRQQDDGQVL
jgi:peptide deformylase